MRERHPLWAETRFGARREAEEGEILLFCIRLIHQLQLGSASPPSAAASNGLSTHVGARGAGWTPRSTEALRQKARTGQHPQPAGIQACRASRTLGRAAQARASRTARVRARACVGSASYGSCLPCVRARKAPPGVAIRRGFVEREVGCSTGASRPRNLDSALQFSLGPSNTR